MRKEPVSNDERAERVPGWRSRDILRAIALAFGLYYGLRMLYVANPVVIIGILGVFLGLALCRLVDRMEKHGIPRSVTAVATVVAFYSALIGGGVLAGPMLKEQARALRDNLPAVIERVESSLQQFTGIASTSQSGASSGGQGGSQRDSASSGREDSASASESDGQRDSGSSSQRENQSERQSQSDSQSQSESAPAPGSGGGGLAALRNFVGPFLSSTASALAGIFIVTFIAIYIAVDPVTYREGVLHLVPYRHRKRVREVMQATTRVLQDWFTAQIIAMTIVGVVTTTGLLLLQVEAAFALGLIAALLEFVPFIGPFVAAAPAIGLALVDSPEKAVAVAVFYFIVQQLEATLLTPLVMKNSLELPPILTIMAQGVMGIAFGLLGVLIAVPLLAAVIVPVKMLYVQDAVGDPVPVFEDEDEDEKKPDD